MVTIILFLWALFKVAWLIFGVIGLIIFLYYSVTGMVSGNTSGLEPNRFADTMAFVTCLVVFFVCGIVIVPTMGLTVLS